MTDPARLLIHAHNHLGSSKGAPNQTDLRRAISSAYYAVFHHFLRSVSDHLIGSSPTHRKRPEYRLVYRSLQHASMSEVCEAVRKPSLSDRYERACGLASFSHGIKGCATAFVDLQRMRHAADYDPVRRFTKAQASAVIDTAAYATMAFDAAPDAEKSLFLHLLVFLVFKVRD